MKELFQLTNAVNYNLLSDYNPTFLRYNNNNTRYVRLEVCAVGKQVL
jgi:hypothetical protein